MAEFTVNTSVLQVHVMNEDNLHTLSQSLFTSKYDRY